MGTLVEATITGHPVMDVSDYGFVEQLPRGSHRSRYYLQCALSDTAEDWPGECLWQGIRQRTSDETLQSVMMRGKFSCCYARWHMPPCNTVAYFWPATPLT